MDADTCCLASLLSTPVTSLWAEVPPLHFTASSPLLVPRCRHQCAGITVDAPAHSRLASVGNPRLAGRATAPPLFSPAGCCTSRCERQCQCDPPSAGFVFPGLSGQRSPNPALATRALPLPVPTQSPPHSPPLSTFAFLGVLPPERKRSRATDRREGPLSHFRYCRCSSLFYRLHPTPNSRPVLLLFPPLHSIHTSSLLTTTINSSNLPASCAAVPPVVSPRERFDLT